MSFDRTFGGFGQAPKFPSPHNFFFLLRYWKRTGDAQALRMVEHTLQNMRHGGIYDQIGFGFHRYSTDARWIVPHFEKMLYDQALMALAFIELYQATGKNEYEISAREIFTYVLRDMTDDQGGFYCAEDADSEGVEGKFYLWTEEEIRSILTKDEADLFLSHYRHDSDMSVQGMQEIPDGQFIPHLNPSSDGDAEDSMTELSGKMEGIRKKLFAVREKRVRPHKDDKILTDWNGLMIAALARGAQVFDEPTYSELHSGRWILLFNLCKPKRAGCCIGIGTARVPFQRTSMIIRLWSGRSWNSTRQRLIQSICSKHWSISRTYLLILRDDQNGGFFFTPADAEELLTRPKELYDGAIPSGNSMAFINTLRLSRFTGDAEMDERAHEIYRAFGAPADAMPTAFTQFLCGLDFAIGPASEVIIAGYVNKEDTRLMLRVLRKSFLPNKIVVFRPESSTPPDIETIAPFVQSHSIRNGQATAYVCSNFTCSLPTNDPEKMMELLDKK